MKPPDYFYFRVKFDPKSMTITLEDASDADVVEVVRCKNCKYFDTDAWRTVDGVPIIVAHSVCRFWAGGCETSTDGYCSHGVDKRKDDYAETKTTISNSGGDA